MKIAQEHLPDTWHGVQTRCLSIIGRYLTANASDDTLTLIGNYARSQDPRVRAQAFETMAELHSHRGCRLPASFFKEACAALRDDYEIVRRAVLKLIWLLGREYPEKSVYKYKCILKMRSYDKLFFHVSFISYSIVVGSDGEDVRMADCAFSQICSLMGDLSPRVRASAMSLLGTMKSVSRRYIEQALDKKQKVVEADRPEVEEKSGSCGAFIHGLEDEFLEV